MRGDEKDQAHGRQEERVAGLPGEGDGRVLHGDGFGAQDGGGGELDAGEGVAGLHFGDGRFAVRHDAEVVEEGAVEGDLREVAGEFEVVAEPGGLSQDERKEGGEGDEWRVVSQG